VGGEPCYPAAAATATPPAPPAQEMAERPQHPPDLPRRRRDHRLHLRVVIEDAVELRHAPLPIRQDQRLQPPEPPRQHAPPPGAHCLNTFPPPLRGRVRVGGNFPQNSLPPPWRPERPRPVALQHRAQPLPHPPDPLLDLRPVHVRQSAPAPVAVHPLEQPVQEEAEPVGQRRVRRQHPVQHLTAPPTGPAERTPPAPSPCRSKRRPGEAGRLGGRRRAYSTSFPLRAVNISLSIYAARAPDASTKCE